MRRYIDAESLLTKIKAYRPYMYLGEDALSYAIKMVELEPSADVRENVRGEWVKVDEQPYFRKHFHKVCCSVCRKQGYDYWNFCPNCGADMRGEQE